MASAIRDPAGSSRTPGVTTAPSTSTTIVVDAALSAAMPGAEDANGTADAPVSASGVGSGGATNSQAAMAASSNAPPPAAIVIRS